MSFLSGVSDFFGLDIGASAVHLVELQGTGPVKSLIRYGYVPIDPKIAVSAAKTDQQALGQVITDLLAQAKVTTRNVAVGIPSDRVFTTIADFDRLAPTELAKTVKYQADSLIPTPLAESKIDWALLGDSPSNKTKVEVLISSVANEFIETRLDLLEAIGLNVIAFEPDNLALVRSILAPDATAPQMVLDIGTKGTDLVIVMNGAPRLTRAIPTGSDALIRAAAQNLNIDQKQAEQFVFKFGVSQNKLEGQIYQAIIGTVDILVSEVDKSIKFFQSRYNNMDIERIIVTGGASTLPEFPIYLANKTGKNVEIGNAWRNVAFATDRQNEMLAVSSHFGVAAGLAERNE